MFKNNILDKFDKSEWFDFSNGFKISEETVNSWIEEGINFLENNKDREFYCSGSGNTLVFITRDENDYCINVCDRYKELDLYRKKWYTMTIEEFETCGKISDLIKLLEYVKEKYGDLQLNTIRNDECDYIEEQNVMLDVIKHDYKNMYYINFY